MSGTDPEIVRRWVRGWTMARGLPWPVRDGDAWRVDVGWPDQKTRYVFGGMSEAVVDLARQITEPWVFLKIFASEGEVTPHLPETWVYPHPGYAMSREGPSGARALPEGYALKVEEERPSVRRVVIAARDGAEVASGRVSWEDGYAVYNLIKTTPDHQRKGLASVVMARLGEMASANGAYHQLLVATPEGRRLYESLGWSLRSEYTTAVILPPGHAG